VNGQKLERQHLHVEYSTTTTVGNLL